MAGMLWLNEGNGRDLFLTAVAVTALLVGVPVLLGAGFGQLEVLAAGVNPLVWTVCLFAIVFGLGFVMRSYFALLLAPVLALALIADLTDTDHGMMVDIAAVLLILVAGVMATGVFAGRRSDRRAWLVVTAVLAGVVLLASAWQVFSYLNGGVMLSEAEQRRLPTSSYELVDTSPYDCPDPDHPVVRNLLRHLRENPNARVRFTFWSSDWSEDKVISVRQMAKAHLEDLEPDPAERKQRKCERRLAKAIRDAM